MSDFAAIDFETANRKRSSEICPRIALLEKGHIIRDLHNENNSAEKELENYFAVE